MANASPFLSFCAIFVRLFHPYRYIHLCDAQEEIPSKGGYEMLNFWNLVVEPMWYSFKYAMKFLF